jgi:hypothetical protein
VSALSYAGHATGYATGSATSIATSARSVATGAHIFVCVRWDGEATGITVTDTEGNTYTALTQIVTSSSFVGAQWFYCLSAAGGASHVVTATFANARTYRSIYAVEVTGGAAAVVETPPKAGLVTTLVSDAYTYSAGALLLVGSGTYWDEVSSGPSVTASGESFATLTTTSNYHAVAYAESAAGGSGIGITVLGIASSRVLATLVVEAVAALPPQQRARVFVAT